MRILQQGLAPTNVRNWAIVGKDILGTTNGAVAISLAPTQAVNVTFIASVKPPQMVLGIPEFTIWQTSVTDSKNIIPYGSNVTAGNYQIIGPWLDLSHSDGNNTAFSIYVGNVDPGTSTTINRSFSASGDDGTLDPAFIPAWTYTGTTIAMGHQSLPARSFTVGVRFTNVALPNAATIVSAILTFTCSSSDALTVLTKIYGIAEDNTATFTSDPTGRTKTTANVSWSLGSITVDVAYATPDITSIIQEIVNRAGWVSGNAMGFLILDNGSGGDNEHIFYGYNFSPPKPTAKLTITYSSAGVTQTIIIEADGRGVIANPNLLGT